MFAWGALAGLVTAYDIFAIKKGKTTLSRYCWTAGQHPWGRSLVLGVAATLADHLLRPPPYFHQERQRLLESLAMTCSCGDADAACS